MVINLRLSDVVRCDPQEEAMGRSWYGYDPDQTSLELWAQNRGVYVLDATRIEAERFVTMSYQGKVLLVAAVTGWEFFDDPLGGVRKKALIGDVLSEGDRARDVLMQNRVPGGRNPVGYFADEEWGVSDITDEHAEHAGRDVVDGLSQVHGQGWQSDPVRRKQVEDAAQDLLMVHYRNEGWVVEDTRFGNPYDAVARRGDEEMYLEAKGTETDGAAVLISPGEVRHARDHLGQCVMGVLSGIRFDADGTLDPESGTFRMVPFEPADDALMATGYRWSLPGEWA